LVQLLNNIEETGENDETGEDDKVSECVWGIKVRLRLQRNFAQL
jgi:hypothetical protein